MNGEMIESQAQKKQRENPFVKFGKRNLIVVLSVLLIGGAVALNWVLFAKDSAKDSDKDLSGGANLDLNQGTQAGKNTEEQDYFATVVINRKRARDEAMEVLQQVVDRTDAQQEAKTKAYDDLTQIAQDIKNESNIETLILAKGFEECIAVISDEAATIVVKTDGLLPSELVQIQEIVYNQAGIAPAKVNIIEKK